MNKRPTRTAVARRKPRADTQPIQPVKRGFDENGVLHLPLPKRLQPATVFAVIGHRGSGHGLCGLYATRERAVDAMQAFRAKAAKHGAHRAYTFTIDERQIEP